MTKKQVIALSSVLCVVGLALGVTLVMSAFGHAGNYSLVAWIIFTILGVSCLGLVAAPGLIFAWYPAEGFSGTSDAGTEEKTDDEEMSQEDDDSYGADDEAANDGESFDDNEFDDDFGEFEDEDE